MLSCGEIFFEKRSLNAIVEYEQSILCYGCYNTNLTRKPALMAARS